MRGIEINLDIFEQVNQLISIGNYIGAKDLLKNIQSQRSLTEKEQLKEKYILSFFYLDQGNFKEGLKYADELIASAKKAGDKLFELDGIIARIENMMGFGLTNEALNLHSIGEHIVSIIPENISHEIKLKVGYLSFLKGRIYHERHETRKSFPYYRESMEIRREMNDLFGLMWSLLNYGIAQREVGDFLDAKPYLEESLRLATELNCNIAKIWNLLHLGFVSYYLHDFSNALAYTQKSLEFSSLQNNLHAQAMAYELIGHCYIVKGELDKTLKYFNLSLTFRTQTGYQNLIAQTLFNIGNVYYQKGEYHQALEYYQKVLSYPEVKDDKVTKPGYLLNIGKLYGELGDFKLAQNYLDEALLILKDREEAIYLSFSIRISPANTLYNLISFMIKQNQIKEIPNYLDRLKKLQEKYPNSVYINQLYRLTSAIVLKASERLMDKMAAGIILKQLIQEEILDLEIGIDAMINFCELLLYELELTGNLDILIEIKKTSSKLSDIAESQHSYSLIAEAYFFQAKLALLELDFLNARALLTRAQRIAEEKDLKNLANKISSEHDRLLTQIEEWDLYIKEPIPLKERIRETKNDILLSKILSRTNNQPNETKEEPVFLFINKTFGVCNYFRDFKNKENSGDQIIAGFISAINAFGQETFSSTGRIDRIKHGDHTIVILFEKELMFAYAFKGQSYFALKKLEKFIDALKHLESEVDIIESFSSNIYILREEVIKDIDIIADDIFLLKD